MRLSSLFGLILALFLAFNSSDAQATDELSFVTGIKSFQAAEFEKSSKNFKQVLKSDPNNLAALYNFGLSEFKSKNLGLAIGAWRKAQAIDPGSKTISQALKYAYRSLSKPLPDPEPGSFESLRLVFLSKTTTSSLLLVAWILMLIAGHQLLRYIGKRREAIDEETPLPKLPILGLLCLVGFLLFASLGALKVYDQNMVRATVIDKQVLLRTGPGESNSDLFEVFEAYDVVVLKQTKDWLQVEISGNITGWLPKESLYITQGQL